MDSLELACTDLLCYLQLNLNVFVPYYEQNTTFYIRKIVFDLKLVLFFEIYLYSFVKVNGSKSEDPGFTSS